MNLRNIKQIITSLIVSLLLSYILIITKDIFTRIIVIPFLIFSISILIRNIFLILNKKRLVKIFSKIYVIAFLVYWFGFLMYWDYISIVNKNYLALLISLIFYLAGIFIIYRRFKKK